MNPPQFRGRLQLVAPLRKPPEVAFQRGKAQLDGRPHNPGTYSLPPGPIQKSLSQKNETGSAVAGRGGTSRRPWPCTWLWGKVVAVPGPLPAPSSHRQEKPASPRLQEGGGEGTLSERLALMDGVLSIFAHYMRPQYILSQPMAPRCSLAADRAP